MTTAVTDDKLTKFYAGLSSDTLCSKSPFYSLDRAEADFRNARASER